MVDLFSQGWNYRKSHTITGSTAGSVSNYQIGIKVYYGAGSDGTETIGNTTFGKVYCNSHCKTDFSDVRFTSSDGSTLLDYWLDYKSDQNNAVFWVEVDSIPSSSSTNIYVYYGNTNASTLSNGANTWDFFDHGKTVATPTGRTALK
ncbi:MAG: DUF2341 domain-containing protein [Candidatus Bathyarchaeota archaeon]|nr:DUF2341 domain-containing protein [Candidatus Bathyarchaeota archaeon]